MARPATPCLYRKTPKSGRYACGTTRNGPGFEFCQQRGGANGVCELDYKKRDSGATLRKNVITILKKIKFCTILGETALLQAVNQTLNANKKHFLLE